MLGLPNYAFFCSRPVFSGISTLPSGPERPGLEKKEGSSSLGRSPIAMSANPKPPLRRCCLVCAFLACISFYCFFVCVFSLGFLFFRRAESIMVGVAPSREETKLDHHLCGCSTGAPSFCRAAKRGHSLPPSSASNNCAGK